MPPISCITGEQLHSEKNVLTAASAFGIGTFETAKKSLAASRPVGERVSASALARPIQT